jgi:transmembrane sensor
MEEKDIKNLLDKYRAGLANEEEIALLESWYLHFTSKDPGIVTDEERLEAFNQVWANLESEQDVKKIRPLWPSIAAAACTLLFLSFGTYFLLHKKASTQQAAQNQIHDIAPGGNKAILTLANGQKINLIDAHTGTLVVQGNTAINKAADGQVVYHTDRNGNTNAKMVYDTLSVPRGGQYQLKLADGSKVWLNSATTVRYPESFAGKERKVELITGEAYFEVVHNARMPFRVVAAGQTVEDIGTHFNINTYADESVSKTTLLEGSIKIALLNGVHQILKPGQTAVIANNKLSIETADEEETLAWINGNIISNDEPLTSIMRKIARRYDVDIIYKEDVSDISMGCAVSTTKKLSSVLDYIHRTENQINFSINGRTITVFKK